jgi:hypothetical protein
MAETLDEVVAAFSLAGRRGREARPATPAAKTMLKHAIVVLQPSPNSPGYFVWLESGSPPELFAGRCGLPNMMQARTFAQALSVVTGMPVEDRTQNARLPLQ